LSKQVDAAYSQVVVGLLLRMLERVLVDFGYLLGSGAFVIETSFIVDVA